MDDMYESWDGDVRVEWGLMAGLLFGIGAMVVGLGFATRAVWSYAIPLVAVLTLVGVVVAVSRMRELREIAAWPGRAAARADHPSGKGHTKTRIRRAA